MRRTYRSKKETGGLDLQDVMQNVNEKTTKFEAFYSQNIKRTKRELSCLGGFNSQSVSNRVRKKKFVRRIKEPDAELASTSKTTFLTPDKSLRVNKGEDLFDKLLNSSVNNSPIVTFQEKRNEISKKKYITRNRAIIRKYNYHSNSDSSGSDKENFISKSPNESNIESHHLLLEEYRSPTNYADSIDDITNNISLINKLKKQYSITPKQSQNKISTFERSPFCSTPFREKYRGQSIFKYSPISTTTLATNPDKTAATRYTLNDTHSILSDSESKDYDRTRNNEPENDPLPNINKSKMDKSVNDNSIQIIEGISNDIAHSPQKFSNYSLEVECKDAPDDDIIDNKELECSISFVGEPSIILQTSECMKLFGFPKVNQSTEVFLNKYKQFQENNSDILIDNVLSDQSLLLNTERSQENSKQDSQEKFQNVESISMYDTCSEDESKESSLKMFIGEPFIKMKRMRKSLFEKYWQKCKVGKESGDTSNCNEHFRSFESSVLNTEQEYSDKESSEDTNIEPTSFVTTRRGKEFFRNDSFLFNLDSPRNSNSSEEWDKTFINNKEDKFSLDFRTLVDQNTRKSSCIDIETNKLNDILQPEFGTHSFEKERHEKSCINDTVTTKYNTIIDKGLDNVKNALSINSEENIIEVEASVTSPKLSKSLGSVNKLETQFTNTKNSERETSSEKTSKVTNIKPSISPKGLHDSIVHVIPCSSINKKLCYQDITIEDDTVDKTIKKIRQSKSIEQPSITMGLKQNNNPETNTSRITRCSARLSQHDNDAFNISEVKNPIKLQPGKRWERSLSIYRRMTTIADGTNVSILDVESLEHKGRKYRQSVLATMEMQDSSTSLHNESIKSRRSSFVSRPIKSTVTLTNDSNISQTSINSTTIYEDLQGFLTEDCDDTVVNLSKLSLGDPEVGGRVLEKFYDTSSRSSTARDYVLRRCNQADALLFDECYPDTTLKNCRKIGEGVYGEVFLWRAGDGRARVLKVIPIAGELQVNGEKQKDYDQIISEIVIAMELSALSAPIPDIESHFNEGKTAETLDLHSVENATDVFNKVLAVRLVYGSYPSRLLDLWDLYDECKGSENDNPAIFPPDQHYIVLELANAGQDLESYQFNNAEQASALFQQVAFGLAVAEQAYQFEHRDLHWGNVLIAPTDQKYSTFVLRGRTHRVPTCGVKATIIDYSLSRVSVGRVLYCNLAEDESLFEAVGDYQFEVYRRMRDRLGNDWMNYEPYTNILWLHYTADKMITALRYTRTNTKIHKHFIAKLKDIQNTILCHGSACEYVITDNEI
ncbi:uncharacterized protein LOC110999696 isoform X1 [Pieris rapae]|uniref:uncharacterized protein LOC110999696 isoform X1 n=1 Tax=Pieris rapae TaxID=64459 RepID=UPI001E27CD0A|nr:uncharacterized protein LOC110999696 isoform X1 [Pieris rapae]